MPGVGGIHIGIPSGGGGVGPFTPTQIPNLVAWYDPAAAYVTLSGANVTAWASRAGSGGSAWDLITAGAAPPQWSATSGRNGGPGVTFARTAGSFIKSGAAAISQPITVVHCLKPTDFAVAQYVSDGVAASDTRDVYLPITTGVVRIIAGAALNSVAVLTANAWGTAVGVYSGASSIVRVNGTPTTGDAGSGASSGIILGSTGAGAAANYKGVISHTFVFDAAVSAANLTLLEAWLATA